MTAYNKNIENEVFNLANDQYKRILDKLVSDEMQINAHGEIESFLDKDGNELMRLLFQASLDLRAQGEILYDKVVGSDGIERTHKRKNCQRKIMSIFGEVSLKRIGYSSKSGRVLYPLDETLNLPVDKYSHGLRDIVANGSAKESFNDVVSDVNKYTAGKVPKRQTEQLTQRMSADFDSFYHQRLLQDLSADQQSDKDDLLILTTDAKGIVVRHDDLRDATRKAAEKTHPKKQTRLSPGEKKNRKRMAQVASVYDVGLHHRKVEDIMDKSAANDSDASKNRPKPKNKRVWASIEKDAGCVIGQMFSEADKRDPERKRQRVVLIDGNQDQIKKIESTATTLNVSIVILMDFIHVLEYLWKAAHALFESDSKEIEAWVKSAAIKLLNSQISLVTKDIRCRATKQNLTEEQRKPVEQCAQYLLNNRQRLDYKTALEKGYPIATGVIEGACRYLIKDRMDITGARWSLLGAESVLKLRALRSSNDLDDYMRFHYQQEHERNYNFSKIAA